MIYGSGAAMGFPPREIKQMTIWEYLACVRGWNRAQGNGHKHSGDPMTDDEYDALVALGERWKDGASGSRS